MKRWSTNRRRTDVLILCGLALAFPVFCPVPLGRNTFFRVYVSGPPWQFGRTRECACFRGTGVTSDTFQAGPVTVAIENGVAP